MPYKNLPEDMWGKMDECVEKVMAQGHDKESAIAICHASMMGQSAALEFVLEPLAALPADHDLLLVDEYVTVQPGEPYRLLPFGTFVKGGKKREITPEIAAKFRLPHFRPPIKRGSHDETTPAGGHIVGLEVRNDGLYAIPELTEQGARDLAEGAYRYHSPEIIWEGAGLEDPATGELIPGPLIVGDALLHTPHLGEATALYTVDSVKELTMENVQIPMTLWEKILAALHVDQALPAPAPEAAPEPAPELNAAETVDYAAKIAELEAYKSQVERMEAEVAHKARVDAFAAQLKETRVAEGAEMLAGMTDEQAEWVVTQFKALSEQVNTGELFGERGTTGGAAPEGGNLQVAIEAYAAEKKINFVQAFEALRREQPELFK